VPSPTVSSAGHRERGTASVELIAVVPFLLLAVLVAVQIAIAAGDVVGGRRGKGRRPGGGGGIERVGRGEADPTAVAAGRRRGGRGRGRRGRGAVPRLLPGLPRLRVSAGSSLGGGDG
jgi:hypothetical protein